MYRSKKEVDKHVESLLSKLSSKEFKSRAYSIARLYYEVGDYTNCQKYVEQYLTLKDSNAIAHKLLGQAFCKLGHKEKALEQFKITLDIDPTQTSLILEICKLLTDDDLSVDMGRAKYWCEKAEATFPRHSVTLLLREKLLSAENPDQEAIISLLLTELKTRPKDALLHLRLLKNYLQANKIKECLEHSSNFEFAENTFTKNYAWYEIIAEILHQNSLNINDWLYQLLLLTVQERLCVLSLTECPNGTPKSIMETNDLIYNYDHSIKKVAITGPPPGFGEFHNNLLQHHKGQIAFHTATFILKKAKKGQLSWRDTTKAAATLMLISWHIPPTESSTSWLLHAPEKQKYAVKRWFLEGSFRCSQSGHYLLSNMQDKSQLYLDQISQNCSGSHWRDKLYEIIFTQREHLAQIKFSYIASDLFDTPVLRLPRRSEVEQFDETAQKEYSCSLHHFVWILTNYKKYSNFKCTIFESLVPKSLNYLNCGPETLNKLDTYAFLYCAALSSNQTPYVQSEKPCILPANITDILCTVQQMKWWDCAYKFTQNELGIDVADVRATLSRGIEVVRCIDNHGLDPVLLCSLGKIFSELAENTSTDEKYYLEARATLYYKSAIPALEKLKNKIMVTLGKKPLFEYTHKDLSPKKVTALLNEAKINVAVSHMNAREFEKAIEILSDLKSSNAFYYISKSYKQIALTADERLKQGILLGKAKSFAVTALDNFYHNDNNISNLMFQKIHELIDSIEAHIVKLDIDISEFQNDIGNKYSFEENKSNESRPEFAHLKTDSFNFNNLSSTPKQTKNSSNFRTAIDTQILETTQTDYQLLEKIEHQIKNLQKKDVSINEFMDQTKTWFEENRKLSNQIILSIHTNIQNTTDQFKQLKLSVDHVKDQIDQCRNECKDVGDLKKEMADLKKEINKLKKPIPEQKPEDNGLFNVDYDYRNNDHAPHFAQMPFAQQMMSHLNPRLVPPIQFPNPYQLYSQNLYNLYSQYSQFAQPPSVPGASPLYDSSRSQVNYPGAYPTPDHMFLDVGHLVPPSTVPVGITGTAVSTLPTFTTVNSVPILSSQTLASSITSKPLINIDPKTMAKALPVNVVITSSDPLPTNIAAPAPVLSVSIPTKHIKGSPHNYQIPMPSNEASKLSRPVFSLSASEDVSHHAFMPNLQTIWKQPEPSPSIPFDVAQSVLSENEENSYSNTFSDSKQNTSKSRTLSEKSNTSIENYDPCPDFKPIIPLPAEVKVTTGEEDETVIFSARAKLFRFTDKQWKERGIGEIKLLKHKCTEKVRVLMRREQIHKICANHIITNEMNIQPMKNETKAYFWIANDFADNTLVLEKFCIRFKTAEIGKLFYNEFIKAVQESVSSDIKQPVTEIKKIEDAKLNTPVTGNVFETNTDKTTVGGFTFSGVPAFKFEPDANKNVKDEKDTEVDTSKVNIFGNITFKTNNNQSLSNIFSSTLKNPGLDNTNLKQIVQTPSKLNNSDTIEEFEPTVEFKPVVPLPALIETKTGEEEEITLFEHRAKLLRLDVATKEWKERGIGNMKLQEHKENNQKIRLLMRREQVMKVCCNHALTKEMEFQKMRNLDKAVTWCAKDFSEGELTPQTFCLRFKTVQACDEFLAALRQAQSKLKDETKAAKEEKNAAKQNDGTSSVSTTWGDQFKPNPGSWECSSCLIRNEVEVEKCNACGNLKNPSTTIKDPKPLNNFTAFKFGTSSTQEEIKKANSTTSSWGDKFKPKSGTWECKSCFVRNQADVQTCCACNTNKDSSKDDSKPDKPPSELPKFVFGIQKEVNEKTLESRPDNVNNAFLSSPVQCKFNFGVPKTDSETVSTPLIEGNGIQKFNFGISSGQHKTSTISTQEDIRQEINEKPSISNLPKNDKTSFSLKESGTFDFVFKPKSPQKGKSPVKSPDNKNAEDSDGNEYASEDESQQYHFSPVIPMPDKVKVVTGEEDEVELYGHRAKLFIFSLNQWKERGKGIVKILKHKQTGKLRVLMRREQVHKICLNHWLTPEINYQLKEDDKTWLFTASDYSEGEVNLQMFCLRFKNKETAESFLSAVNEARNNFNQIPKTHEKDEVEFVTEIQASSDEKQRAKELMLPENFYTYVYKKPCKGCRGCEDSEKIQVSGNDKTPAKTIVLSPTKSTHSFQTPTNSLYGTPANLKTPDTSIFKTPMESMNSDSDASNTSNSLNTSDETEKENTLVATPIQPDELHLAKQLSQNQTSIPFAPNPAQSLVSSKISVLAAPKLNVNSSETEKRNTDPKSIFGSLVKKSVFGQGSSILDNASSNNKSIFSFTSNKNDNDNPQVKSIFGETDQKPLNLFSGNSYGSLFGPGSLKNSEEAKNTNNIFGTNTSRVFEEGKSLFGNLSNHTSNNIFVMPKKTDEKIDKLVSGSNIFAEKACEGTTNHFMSALSSSGPGITQKKADFVWEGTGQQLFNKSPIKEGDTANEGAGGDEEYDPHYEPIVPLPDKIEVTTGEESEEILYNERCKLYRYDNKTREWKERGVGEIKILYHPEKKTYRLLLRRELIHKAVLNMLLHMDLELLSMNNSDRAWTWAGRNFAENPAGEQETLAVRFKSPEQANIFKEKATECIKKMQAMAAQAIREQNESSSKGVAPLRLPKSMAVGDRADGTIFANVGQVINAAINKANGQSKPIVEEIKDQTGHEEVEEYDSDHNEDDENYYNEEEEECSEMYYYCEGSVVITAGGAGAGDASAVRCDAAGVQVLYDADLYSPKILLTDLADGQVLLDMLIYTDTEFQLDEDSVTWTGMDFTSNEPVSKKSTVTFADSEVAMKFYDSCETSKAATYSSTDPES